MGINRYPGNVITSDANTPTVTSASGTWTLEEAYQNIGNWPMAQSQIQNSLRFNDDDSAYLSRTPASAGNRKTFTWSGWVKRSQATDANGDILFSGRIDDNNRDSFGFAQGIIQVFNVSSGSVTTQFDTTAVFRDSSAWYHVLFSVDTTQATEANRFKIYVNGSQITQFSTANYPSQNEDFFFNSTGTNYIGVYGYSTLGGYFDGYLTDINFIDGLALGPEYFGFTDPNGIWQPKPYKGAYGTNGFYLPMTLSATATGFSTVTYEGNASTQNITGVGFAPDFVWIKERTEARDHVLFDTVRGSGKALFSNLTAAEDTDTASMLSAFNPDGFTVGASSYSNSNNQNYVAWCWDAGSSTVTNNDGTITSTVRASQANGVSIVTYTGNGSASATTGHGLGATPAMVIVKSRSNATSWHVWHTSLSSGYNLNLNSTGAQEANSGTSNGGVGTPTSSVITFQSGTLSADNVVGNSRTFVAYCFSEISGFSKFGSYTGNGSSTGPTVTLGFKPAFVMVKRTDSTGHWVMMDSTRDPVSPIDKKLLASASDAEITGSNLVSFTDTGFQLVDTNTGTGAVNESGATYIYMAFADTRAFDPFDDYSGNGNNWQPNNIGTDDVFTDVPTNQGTDTGAGGEVRGNYATLNPLDVGGSVSTFSNGNLDVVTPSSGGGACRATFGVSSGKWYWEVTPTVNATALQIGIVSSTAKLESYFESCQTALYFISGYKGTGPTGSNTAYGSTITNGDVVGVGLDLDGGTLTFYKNGVSMGTAFSSISGTYSAGLGDSSNSISVTANVNFGQRPFAYTAPSGFKALCTQNLPEPTVVDGGNYFNAVLYTGNGGTNTITTDFTPGFVWQKNRSSAADHILLNSVVGGSAYLRSNSTAAESPAPGYMTFGTTTSFSSTDIATNQSGQSYVAWTWAANGAGVSNTAGTITSTVSANTTAGFSIVTYTGTGANATVGHGLGVAPSFVIIKRRSTSGSNWLCYHKSLTATSALYLNTTEAKQTFSDIWNNTEPTSTVMSLGTTDNCNLNGGTYVAYCFAPVAGYSAFGSYTGNGSTDGPFVYTGFRPRWVMVKLTSSSGQEWCIQDSSRIGYNPDNAALFADLSSAEYASNLRYVDFTSNGFKIRNSTGNQNASGGTYIYAAFAENPFKLSRAR